MLEDDGCTDEGLEDDLEEEEEDEGVAEDEGEGSREGSGESSSGSLLAGCSKNSSLLEQQRKQQQRLPLEDFMRKIVFQINSTSGKKPFYFIF